jgi:chromosome segregation ATPase
MEIEKLKGKNEALVMQLKRFNQDLDSKMNKIKLTKDPTVTVESKEAKLLNEIDCLNKMIKVLDKEKEVLETTVNKKTGYDRVVHLEHKITSQKQNFEDTGKLILSLKKQVIELGSQLEKANNRREHGLPVAEVIFFFLKPSQQNHFIFLRKTTLYDC